MKTFTYIEWEAAKKQELKLLCLELMETVRRYEAGQFKKKYVWKRVREIFEEFKQSPVPASQWVKPQDFEILRTEFLDREEMYECSAICLQLENKYYLNIK